jgi:hypothetical protein
MIVTTAFTLLVLGHGPGEILHETHIYVKPGLEHAVVTGKGTGFLLDREESTLCAFDFEKRVLREVASKGRGPGQLERPSSVTAVGNRLIVRDRGTYHLFSLEGVYQKR